MNISGKKFVFLEKIGLFCSAKNGSGSVGRASVSKTEGREFEPLLPCSKPSERMVFYYCRYWNLMKKLVIFDLDGTLLDSLADLAASVNHALARHGYPTHELASYKHFVGSGIYKLLERALLEGERTSENVAF